VDAPFVVPGPAIYMVHSILAGVKPLYSGGSSCILDFGLQLKALSIQGADDNFNASQDGTNLILVQGIDVYNFGLSIGRSLGCVLSEGKTTCMTWNFCFSSVKQSL
jgi:hypothetical protein